MDQTALFNLSYGLYIISANDGEKDAGCVVNTLHQVTASPVQVSVAVNKDNYTKQLIDKTKRFEAVVLTQNVDMEVVGTFGFHSSIDTEKFAKFSYARDEYHIPYLKQHVAARLSCRVVNQVDIGSHILFIAEVEDAQNMEKAEVMTYAYYHKVKNGTTPKNASSYQELEKKSGWRCSVCGYIYEGDLLPEDFTCPICGVPASCFEKV